MPSNDAQSAPAVDSSPASEEAFRLLADVVSEQSAAGGVLTASQAYVKMRQRSYGGFNLQVFGYRRFRDFLMDAAQSGYVIIDETRPGDFALIQPEIPATTNERFTAIRPDLWKAFIDWSAGIMRLYDITQDRAVMLPAEPAPLEPARFKEIRERRKSDPDNFILINPIGLAQQLDWRREFAEQVPDQQIKQLLDSALVSEKPVKLFNAVLRDTPEYQLKWKHHLTSRVRTEIERWRDTVGISIEILVERKKEDEESKRISLKSPTSGLSDRDRADLAALASVLRGSHPARTRVSSYSDLLSSQAIRGTASPREHSSVELSEIRRLLHFAIDRMPEEELKNLCVPLRYLFED